MDATTPVTTPGWISAPWFWPLVAALVLLALVLWVLWPVKHRTRNEELKQALQQMLDRLDREWRDELARSASATRQDLTASLAAAQQSLLAQASEVARTQQEQLDGFRDQLASTQQTLTSNAQAAREAQDAALARASQAQDAALTRASERQASSLERMDTSLAQRMHALTEGNERRLVEVRQSVEARLNALAQTNEAKLEQMRLTVDEKLHATLEQRLGESFRQVAERLDSVQRGLGEMQKIAADVGSLNRTLANVKVRGIFGEVRLAALLEQVFTPEQYATNVETVPGSNHRVEFAIRLPGREVRDGREGHGPVWLPIDAKFPREDYERLLDAQERADAVAVAVAGKAIETRLRDEARTISSKYLAAPHTVDFAILFLPTEGLYAEALRRPGLHEALQREHRVMLAGPTTLLAMLESLQMGFRTLALEARSAEVWEVLGAVKTEFAKFGDMLAKTKKKLDEASSNIDKAAVRSRAMARRLRGVEALPQERTRALLGDAAFDDNEAEPGADASVDSDIDPDTNREDEGEDGG
jgi:DNA recombination protein RmuC